MQEKRQVKISLIIKMYVNKETSNGWGNFIEKNLYVVKGMYYEEQEVHYFILFDKKPKVLMLSHLVRSIKIPLFTISADVYEAILLDIHPVLYA